MVNIKLRIYGALSPEAVNPAVVGADDEIELRVRYDRGRAPAAAVVAPELAPVREIERVKGKQLDAVLVGSFIQALQNSHMISP